MKLSCSTMGLCKTINVFQALKEIRAAGFDGADLSLNRFSYPGGALQNDSWWRLWTQAVGSYAAELGLTIGQAHASWEQTIPADMHYAPPMHIYERTLQACKLLGCGILVFHPLAYPYAIESAEQTQIIQQYNIRWFRELLPCAAQAGVRIAIENQYDYHRPGGISYCYDRAEQLLPLLQALPAEWVGACIDSGHAHISGQKVGELLRSVKDRLLCLHLHDNCGSEDLHLLPGGGTLDWQDIFSTLRELHYRGSINAEPVGELHRLSEAERAKQLVNGINFLSQFTLSGGI